ncbi:SDR family oxidoreductase [Acuticoccus sp. MNP-M23]|uniref:SDR family oxidoreductase n=1 Tax=Acuticoccus sp. MNP-M23 TaxID=3072793 RepID=UPI002814D4D3|nr:SDR family oxidoreductase [Acuticoccus sp. MNP-M23]WMS44193.1 SDR family oxidoreductase [Acuticoccus sp. MNP-M23]
MHKTALITGAAHRIGRAIATDLAAHGYDIAIHANRSVDAARDLSERLARDHGVATTVLTGDLADPADVEALVPAAIDALGPLSLLVNNASQFAPDDAQSLASPLWRSHMAINAEAPARLTSALAAQTDSPGLSRLAVNIIDQRVWKPTPRYLSYSASKAALWWLTRTMAQALAPDVRVNAIAPGPTLKAASQTDADFGAIVAAVPLGKAPDLADFGRTVRYLHGAQSITGQMLALDGGQHLSWQTPDAVINE